MPDIRLVTSVLSDSTRLLYVTNIVRSTWSACCRNKHRKVWIMLKPCHCQCHKQSLSLVQSCVCLTCKYYTCVLKAWKRLVLCCLALISQAVSVTGIFDQQCTTDCYRLFMELQTCHQALLYLVEWSNSGPSDLGGDGGQSRECLNVGISWKLTKLLNLNLTLLSVICPYNQ